VYHLINETIELRSKHTHVHNLNGYIYAEFPADHTIPLKRTKITQQILLNMYRSFKGFLHFFTGTPFGIHEQRFQYMYSREFHEEIFTSYSNVSVFHIYDATHDIVILCFYNKKKEEYTYQYYRQTTKAYRSYICSITTIQPQGHEKLDDVKQLQYSYDQFVQDGHFSKSLFIQAFTLPEDVIQHIEIHPYCQQVCIYSTINPTNALWKHAPFVNLNDYPWIIIRDAKEQTN
jgi:hypothetical protein